MDDERLRRARGEEYQARMRVERLTHAWADKPLTEAQARAIEDARRWHEAAKRRLDEAQRGTRP